MTSNIQQTEMTLGAAARMWATQLASFMREVERLRWEVSAAIWESHEQEGGEHPDTAALIRVRSELLELGAYLRDAAARLEQATGYPVAWWPEADVLGTTWSKRLYEHFQHLMALNLSMGGLLGLTGREAYPDPDGLSQARLRARVATDGLASEIGRLDHVLSEAIGNAQHGGLVGPLE